MPGTAGRNTINGLFLQGCISGLCRRAGSFFIALFSFLLYLHIFRLRIANSGIPEMYNIPRNRENRFILGRVRLRRPEQHADQDVPQDERPGNRPCHGVHALYGGRPEDAEGAEPRSPHLFRNGQDHLQHHGVPEGNRCFFVKASRKGQQRLKMNNYELIHRYS